MRSEKPTRLRTMVTLASIFVIVPALVLLWAYLVQ